MNLVTLDFETYWSATHSLTKMSPIEYVMHRDTDVISLAMKINDGPTRVEFGGVKIKAMLDEVDWSDVLVIGHNMSGFDAMILAWRYNVNPKMWGCTLAMARPIHAKDCSLSLGALSERYGLGVKDSTALVNTKGKRLYDFTADEVAAMREYNKQDVELCYQLFKKLYPQTTKRELSLIDMTIRMLTEPQFELDSKLLEATKVQEVRRKTSMLLDVATLLGAYKQGMSDEGAEEAARKTLASAPKFSELLRSLNVPVPMKPSPTNPAKEVPALAKTDEAFIALQEHSDPLVATAARARLGVKSTILETRIDAFLTAARNVGGKLPVPLRYCGADTTSRWSGEQYNPQNMPRVGKTPKPSDALRMSLRAPEGHKVVVADLSGIELRVNHFLWKVPYSTSLWTTDPAADLYVAAGSEWYGIPVSEVTKDMRQLEKIKALGLGFGAGPVTFRKVAKLMGGIELDEDESKEAVQAWRGMHPEIVTGWKTCHNALSHIYAESETPIDPWGMCRTVKGGIKTPQGMIRYPDLRMETSEGKSEWVYGNGRHKTRIYAGKVTENCIAEGTLVLTDSGWKPIECVTKGDLVHDGDSFVNHNGTIFKSIQQCVTVDGVYMTANHEVLDERSNWKEASQIQGLYRPAVRSTDRLESVAHERENLVLGLQMHMRETVRKVGVRRDEGSEARGDPQLRMHVRHVGCDEERNARHVKTSGVQSLAQHDRPLQAAVASSLEKLRGSWNICLSTVARSVRELLGGHGADVSAWFGLGQGRQQRPLLAGELQVGFSPSEYDEQTGHYPRGYSNAVEAAWDSGVNAILPASQGQAAGRTGGQTKSYKVYDILNAGPQHRFVVLGAGGPFVVHNCVQHLAREVIADNALEVYRRTGLRPCLMVHDELVYVVSDNLAEEHLATVQDVMRTPPKWWPELVTWSEGDIAQTYGEAK